jgi:hypothetical protein
MAVDQSQTGLPFGAQTRNPFNYSKVEQISRNITNSWLTLEQITQQLNLIDDESQDAYLSSLELAVRMAIEDFLGLSIFSTTYRVYYGPESLVSSPASFDLPEVSQNSNPLEASINITSVSYWNAAVPPVLTVIPNTEYMYDPSGNKVIVQSLPTDINTVMTAPIVIVYSTVANVLASYPVIQQAGLLLLTHLYNNRSATTNPIQHKIPYGIEMLLRPYKPLVM